MMPALACPAVIRPGQFGPMSRVSPPRTTAIAAQHVERRDALGDADRERQAGVGRFEIASAANGGGTKMTDALAPVSARASATVLNTGQPSCVVPALARGDAADDLRAVGLRRLGVKRAFAAGDALDEQAGVLVDQYSHVSSFCPAATTFVGRLRSSSSAVVKLRPLSLQHLLALLDVGAFHADDDRHAARRGP